MKSPRFTIKRAMILVALSALVFGAARLYHSLYSMEYNDAVVELGKVRGIEDVHIRGFDDLTYELTRQTFSIAGRPDAVFEILAAQDGLTGKPDHLWICRMGPWQFYETSFGFMNTFDLAGRPVKATGTSDFIDLGRAGPYNTLLPCKIEDMNDVIVHYDELVRHFATWPDGQAWGEARPGRYDRVMYCVRPVGRPRPQAPANFP